MVRIGCGLDHLRAVLPNCSVVRLSLCPLASLMAVASPPGVSARRSALLESCLPTDHPERRVEASWNGRSDTRSGAILYRFFSLSNLGSLLALLSYPVLLETQPDQRATGLVVERRLRFLRGPLLFILYRTSSSLPFNRVLTPADSVCSEPPSIGGYLIWIALSGSASALLLSITNYLTSAASRRAQTESNFIITINSIQRIRISRMIRNFGPSNGSVIKSRR